MDRCRQWRSPPRGGDDGGDDLSRGRGRHALPRGHEPALIARTTRSARALPSQAAIARAGGAGGQEGGSTASARRREPPTAPRRSGSGGSHHRHARRATGDGAPRRRSRRISRTKRGSCASRQRIDDPTLATRRRAGRGIAACADEGGEPARSTMSPPIRSPSVGSMSRGVDDAVNELRAAIASIQLIQAACVSGVIAARQKQYDDALQYFTSAKKLAPSYRNLDRLIEEVRKR